MPGIFSSFELLHFLYQFVFTFFHSLWLHVYPYFCTILIGWNSAGIRRTSSISAGPGRNETIASLLASLMEVVRTTVACECVYVRGMVVKALIWMQSPHESLDELKSIIASELSDPAWPAALVNDVLLTLHARFKVSMIFFFLQWGLGKLA